VNSSERTLHGERNAEVCECDMKAGQRTYSREFLTQAEMALFSWDEICSTRSRGMRRNRYAIADQVLLELLGSDFRGPNKQE